MGLFNSIRMGSSGVVDAYEIDRSIRLNRNDSSYFEISRSSDGNRKKWTFSTWLKVANHGNDLRGIFAYNGTGSNRENFTFEADGKMAYQLRVGGSNKASVTTTKVFRDPSAWYHIVFIWDSDNGTSADRAIIYVNGVRQEVTTYITPDSGAETYINSTTTHYINNDAHWGAGDYYYAETYFIDGQAYNPTYFAETNSTTGQWVPKEYTSGFSGNSFYCNYSDNSGNTSTTIGKDSSGLGNNITPFNVSVSSGTGNDSMKDTPTNNFATFNAGLPIGSSSSYSNGNLEFNSGTNAQRQTRSTFAHNSGKWYAEFKLVSFSHSHGSYPYIGIAAANTFEQTWVGAIGNAVNRVGTAYINGSSTSGGFSYTSGDIIGIAMDVDNLLVYFYKNGTIQNSGNGFAITAKTDKGYQFAASIWATAVWAANFGGIGIGSNSDENGHGNFTYAVPSGYLAECSANLSEPTIAEGNKHFDTLLYTGTGSSQNITGLEFQPDWVWIKKRNSSENHNTADAVRGAGISLRPNTTGAETSSSGAINAFLSNGFTVVDAGETNESGHTYVGWNWNAGGSTVTNNEGSKSAQVRANPTAGFSIISYTGDGNSGATVGHGLGVAPKIMFHKDRDSSNNWYTITTAVDGSADYLYLNLTNAKADSGVTAPTSSLVYFTASSESNHNGRNYIMYAFSEVAGYSKFGSYEGNGSSDGPFVFTGFRPAVIIFKNASTATNWEIYDTKRQPNNPTLQNLYPNSTSSEETSGVVEIDILSNGFKIKTSWSEINNNGDTHLYLAFAESPFKYSRAR